MFDSLDEQMRSDENRAIGNSERMIRWLLVALVSITIFGGLYLAVHFMQG